VVLHPGTSAPARAWPAPQWVELAQQLCDEGMSVVVTGTQHEQCLTRQVAAGQATDLGGRTTLHELASVLAGASSVVVANTGPAHLAAAVGAPIVSLFAPTVPASAWAPYAVPCVLLGDQEAECAGTGARVCPVPGHPCLSSVSVDDVLVAVRKLAVVTA
jgi:ADP-heptose:LPS heptosyltransferase